MRIAGSFQAFWICGHLKDSHSLRKRHRNRSLFTTLSYLFLAFLEEVKNPEAFGGTGAVRSVTIHGRHGGRPSSIKAEASFGVSDPTGMNRLLRALERVALQDIGEGKEKQQQRPLERLPDNPGSYRREHHQHIDIEDLSRSEAIAERTPC